jgi:RND family efflux transporter MFP subunit
MTTQKSLTLLALLLLAGALAACGGGESDAAERETATVAASVDVEIATATLETIPLLTRVTGSLEPLRSVSPGTKILGRVERVAVVEGDRVERGAPLARLESRDLEAAVAQADAAVRMAQAQLENARVQHRRMTDLHGRGSVTDKNLEDATAAFRVAEAGLDQARANLAAARVMLGYAEISSPLAGWVVEKRVEAGDMATPGMPLFTVEDLSKVKVVVQVSEADVGGLAEGAAARVEVLGREYEATIDRVVPAGDPASRTFAVKLVLDNPQGALKSGMFVRASFAHGEQQALRVPETALVRRGQLEGLFLAADDGRLRLRWVKTGRRDGGRVEILSGLEGGERYAVAPPPGVVDGAVFRE